jgi:hypothetical protein
MLVLCFFLNQIKLVVVLVPRLKTPKCRKLELLLQKQIYYKGLTIELSVKSPCLHPIFWPAFTCLSSLSMVCAKQGNFY